ncbi:hypothetical protein [Rhizobium sp. MHM7A]|uniref:hypothetical protein n=1 Tax=Rhizobium sp. MHM7A TaxID=2583233 RepID=UPI00148607EA|nr:hypothetical protein [Rhizobium sp. MHM7A]
MIHICPISITAAPRLVHNVEAPDATYAYSAGPSNEPPEHDAEKCELFSDDTML